MTDRLPDMSTDESHDVQMEGNFPTNWTFMKLCPAIFVSIFTMNLADGHMDGTDDRHTDGQMDFRVELHFG